jgi:hypothetical protein
MTVIVSNPKQNYALQPAKDLPKQCLLPEDLYKYFFRDSNNIEYHIQIGTVILYYQQNQEFLVRKMIPGDMIWLDYDLYGGRSHSVHWPEIDWNGFKIIDSSLSPYHETTKT